jgi:hypothetical protein
MGTRKRIGEGGSGVVYLVEIVAEADEIDPLPVARILHRSNDGNQVRCFFPVFICLLWNKCVESLRQIAAYPWGMKSSQSLRGRGAVHASVCVLAEAGDLHRLRELDAREPPGDSDGKTAMTASERGMGLGVIVE